MTQLQVAYVQKLFNVDTIIIFSKLRRDFHFHYEQV